jgi:hypothetical protein
MVYRMVSGKSLGTERKISPFSHNRRTRPSVYGRIRTGKTGATDVRRIDRLEQRERFTGGERAAHLPANFSSTQNSRHSYHSRHNRRIKVFAGIGGYDG